ncbi:hypothetical protein [Paenibacillus sp. 23TSA30-6]|uniref:hypothetical protein n=1 Tax=Paenibacillus sp. 23TSA30-6 TaxID=2546104 RepID=UPI0017887090|nr:hypothetical protein [Paenibacillus sp. 23TSA30-6]
MMLYIGWAILISGIIYNKISDAQEFNINWGITVGLLAILYALSENYIKTKKAQKN